MNYAESFDQFSSRVGPTDLLIYAGAGIIFYVLFQDKLGPVKDFVQKIFNKSGVTTVKLLQPSVSTKSTDNLFFELVSSWKKTRDLAEQTGCKEAVKVADQMFPYLSPSGCNQGGVEL